MSVDRSTLINKTLDCYLTTNDKNGSVVWFDVCVTNPPVPTPQEDGRDKLVAEELDAASEKLKWQKKDFPENSHSSLTSKTVEEIDNNSVYETQDDNIDVAEEMEEESDQNAYENRNLRDRIKKTELGLQFSSYDYSADSYFPYYYALLHSVGNEVEKSGKFFGVSLAYTYRRPYDAPVHTLNDLKEENGGPGYPFTFYRVEADVAWGEVSYKAYIPGKREGFDAWRANIRLLGGYDLLSQDFSFMATPYIGIGYKRFVDKAGGWVDVRTTSYQPYEKAYQYFYIPFGVETLKHMNTRWDMGFRAEASVLLFGTVAFGQSDIQGSFPATDFETGDPINVRFQDSESDLQGGFGFKTSFKMIRKFELINLFAEPFFEFWYLGQSKKVESREIDEEGVDRYPVYPDGSPYQDTFEPSHYTVESGLRAGVQF